MVNWTQIALAFLGLLSAVLTAVLGLYRARLARGDKERDDLAAQVEKRNEQLLAATRELGTVHAHYARTFAQVAAAATATAERANELAHEQALAIDSLTGGGE